MSFTSRNLGFLIGDPTFLSGTPAMLSEDCAITEEGWDTLTQVWAHRRAAFSAEDVATAYPTGARLGSRTFWLSSVRPRRAGTGVWTAEVTYKGWAIEKPAVIKISAAADQQQATNILAPRYVGDTVGGVYATVQTHENTPTISVLRLVEDVVTNTMTDLVGQAATPPVTVAVADTVWDFLTKFVWHWPQGWVLMASNEDRLPGTVAAAVTDQYKFIRDKTPG